MWHYTIAGRQLGPVPLAEVQRLIKAGSLGPASLVWAEGMPRWLPAGGLPALFPDGEPKLEPFWKWILYGSVLVPFIGGWVIVVLSSVMYYTWRPTHPGKAKSINRHGWLAFLVDNAVWITLWVLLSR